MNSVAFEESILNDPRFLALCTLVKNKRVALGMIVEASFVGAFYKEKDRRDIPRKIWNALDLEPMLHVFLAVVGPDDDVFLDYHFEENNG